ncbi:MAG: STAS domain-containing protein [Chlamydiae bacterium]|nr:STAS domain-containing protein [Chlamydiota bacterium]
MVGLRVDTDWQQDKVILRPEGRLDTATVGILEKEITKHIDEQHYKIMLDFKKVDYLSSAAMRLLLGTTKKLKSLGGKLTLAEVHEEVMEIIKMAGFDSLLSIHDKEKEALDALG